MYLYNSPPTKNKSSFKHSSKFIYKNVTCTRPHRTTQFISKHGDHKATFPEYNAVIPEINKKRMAKAVYLLGI